MSEQSANAIKQKCPTSEKHKEDVFRLQQFFIPGQTVSLSPKLMKDMCGFVDKIKVEELDLGKLNVEGSKNEKLDDLIAYYMLEENAL